VANQVAKLELGRHSRRGKLLVTYVCVGHHEKLVMNGTHFQATEME